jgi:hypothetical protein
MEEKAGDLVGGAGDDPGSHKVLPGHRPLGVLAAVRVVVVEEEQEWEGKIIAG